MAGQGPSVTVGQYSTAGRKERNDDSYGVVVPRGAELQSKGIAMAVADGMSSSTGAKIASETCVKSFLEDYYATHESWTVKKSAALVLKSVNSWLSAQNIRKIEDGSDLISTFSGAILKAGTLHVFHVGDTRISLLRDGTIEPLTRDHRIDARRARHYLARSMGADTNLEIDYRSESVAARDLLIFTSDGVHEHLSSGQVLNVLRQSPDSLDAAAESIVQLALKNGSEDNLTCQLVRITDPGAHDSDAHLAELTALPFPPDLAPGMTFEGYRIVRELHASSRSQLYLAEDLASGGPVVLKTPSVNFEDDPAYLEMFTREDWIGRLIESPHVLKVLQPSRSRRSLYYAMEYFEGETLRQWMIDNPNADLAAVRAIIDQVVKGLRAFHRKDIVHRDLKPENIMIDRHGLVKIIDFGSSRSAGQVEMKADTEILHHAGTIDYTAPEYHSGAPDTNRSDIFSLGVIAYEMLSGRLPYGKGFTSARDVSKRAYVTLRSIRADIPDWIDAAVAKAVEKNPDQRTDALSALAEDLKRPNPALGYDRPRPLIERDPLLFWRGLSLLLGLMVVVLLFLLARA